MGKADNDKLKPNIRCTVEDGDITITLTAFQKAAILGTFFKGEENMSAEEASHLLTVNEVVMRQVIATCCTKIDETH